MKLSLAVRTSLLSASVWICACGAAPAPSASNQEKRNTPSHSTTTPPSASSTVAVAEAEPAEALYARFERDFWSCYEEGKRTAPNMGAGKVTWLISVDEAGKSECVVPMQDTGFTQKVEDCMAERIAREQFKPGGEWSASLPIRVSEGKMLLGAGGRSGELETLEWHGIDDEDVTTTVQGLVPSLAKCMQNTPVDRARTIRVGARIGADGKVMCALASGSRRIPHEVKQCAIDTLSGAQFHKPKGGFGLVSIPIQLTR